MAYSITTRKELNKHVDFDISIITGNLADGEFFAEDKKVTSRSKVYVVKIPKVGQDKLKGKLRKIGVKSPFTLDTITLDVEEQDGLSLRLQKTGKTSTASDGKTTAMQENASLEIIKQGLANNKTYTSAKDIAKKPIYKTLIEIYPELNDDWLNGLYAQYAKMNQKFPNAKFDTFNRDGGFMDWITSYVKTNYRIAKKDAWNPADIWLIKDEEKIKTALKEAKSLEQFNDIMRTLYKKRQLCGISLKKVSGKIARFIEVNMTDAIPDSSAYSLDSITQKWSVNQSGNLDSTDTVIQISTGTKSMNGKKSVKFQIRQNSKGFNNLKFEGTQVGAGAARLGKAPLDMLQNLLSGYGIIDFVNDHNKYPKTIDEWKEVKSDYKKMYDATHSSITSNITKNKFVENVESSFESGDNGDATAYTTSKLMQLAFVSKLITLSDKDQDKLLTEMSYLAKKEGPIFGPHGKLY